MTDPSPNHRLSGPGLLYIRVGFFIIFFLPTRDLSHARPELLGSGGQRGKGMGMPSLLGTSLVEHPWIFH